MHAEKQDRDKQMFAERIWLLYFNDVLFRDGIITADDYHKLIHQINSRTQIVDSKKEKKHHG